MKKKIKQGDEKAKNQKEGWHWRQPREKTPGVSLEIP